MGERGVDVNEHLKEPGGAGGVEVESDLTLFERSMQDFISYF